MLKHLASNIKVHGPNRVSPSSLACFCCIVYRINFADEGLSNLVAMFRNNTQSGMEPKLITPLFDMKKCTIQF